MTIHRNFNPEICKLLDELEELRMGAHLRGRNLLRPDELRAGDEGAAEAYAYCMMRIRDLDIGGKK